MRTSPDSDEPSSVPPHEEAPEVTLFIIPTSLAQSHAGGLDDQRDQAADCGVFTGGINDFASEEATVDAVNQGHPPAVATELSPTAHEELPAELLSAADIANVDEPGLTNLLLWAQGVAPAEQPIDEALPPESARPSAPWRSPDEMLLEASAQRAQLDEPVDDPLNGGDDSSTSWDAGMIAADSTMSTAATAVQPFGRRWLGMVAGAFLLFAIGMSLLPADGPAVYRGDSSDTATRASATPSVDPASSGPLEKVTGTAGVLHEPEDPRATSDPLPWTKSSVAVDGLAAPDSTPSIPGSLSAADWLARGDRQSALSSSRPSSPPNPADSSAAGRPLSNESPVTTAGAKPETALASAAARDKRSDTTEVVAPRTAPAPQRNNVTTPPPPPPAADPVARTETPSSLSSEIADRTLPPTTTGESTARDASPAAPEIPPAATVDRAGAAGEATAIDGITATLRRLQLAYEQRDAGLVKSVWPTVNERALTRAFDGLRSQSVTFDNCWMNVFSASADVECRGVTTYVPRVGGQYQRTESRQWTFRVQKGDDHWLIASAEAR